MSAIKKKLKLPKADLKVDFDSSSDFTNDGPKPFRPPPKTPGSDAGRTPKRRKISAGRKRRKIAARTPSKSGENVVTTSRKSPRQSPAAGTPPSSPAAGTPSASQAPGTPPASQAPGTPRASQAPGTPPASQAPGTPPASQAPGTPRASQAPGTPPASQAPATPPSSQAPGSKKVKRKMTAKPLCKKRMDARKKAVEDCEAGIIPAQLMHPFEGPRCEDVSKMRKIVNKTQRMLFITESIAQKIRELSMDMKRCILGDAERLERCNILNCDFCEERTEFITLLNHQMMLVLQMEDTLMSARGSCHPLCEM